MAIEKPIEVKLPRRKYFISYAYGMSFKRVVVTACSLCEACSDNRRKSETIQLPLIKGLGSPSAKTDIYYVIDIRTLLSMVH